MSNSTVNLQIIIDQDIKSKASQEARRQGFGSLQDATRFMLTKLAYKQINIGIIPEPVEYLPEKEEIRLDKIHNQTVSDLKKGKATIVKNGTDLIRKLSNE